MRLDGKFELWEPKGKLKATEKNTEKSGNVDID